MMVNKFYVNLRASQNFVQKALNTYTHTDDTLTVQEDDRAH